jgi:hypothetical protein
MLSENDSKLFDSDPALRRIFFIVSWDSDDEIDYYFISVNVSFQIEH